MRMLHSGAQAINNLDFSGTGVLHDGTAQQLATALQGKTAMQEMRVAQACGEPNGRRQVMIMESAGLPATPRVMRCMSALPLLSLSGHFVGDEATSAMSSLQSLQHLDVSISRHARSSKPRAAAAVRVVGRSQHTPRCIWREASTREQMEQLVQSARAARSLAAALAVAAAARQSLTLRLRHHFAPCSPHRHRRACWHCLSVGCWRCRHGGRRSAGRRRAPHSTRR